MLNIKIGSQIININMNSKFFLASVTVVTTGYSVSSYFLKERDVQIKNIEKDRDILIKDRDVQMKERECQMIEKIAQLKYK